MKIQMKKTKKQEKQEKKDLSVLCKILIAFAISCAFGVISVFVIKMEIGVSLIGMTYLFVALFFAFGIPYQVTEERRKKVEDLYNLSGKYTMINLRQDYSGRKLNPSRILLCDKEYTYQARIQMNNIRIRIISKGKVIYAQNLTYRQLVKNFKPWWE